MGTQWTKARYPGDTVRIQLLRRGDELGDVRIQDYSPAIAASFKVGAFLPGITECFPGDTPKTWPEKHDYCISASQADAVFDLYVKRAKRDGWREYKP